MKCPNCGEEIADGSNFCEYCGAKVKQEKKSHLALWISIVAIVVAVVASALLFKNSSHYKVSQCHDYETWAIDEIYKKFCIYGNPPSSLDSVKQVFYDNCNENADSLWDVIEYVVGKRVGKYSKENVELHYTIHIRYVETICDPERCAQKCDFDIGYVTVTDNENFKHSQDYIALSSHFCGDGLVEEIKGTLGIGAAFHKIANVIVEADSEVCKDVMDNVYEAVNQFKRETGTDCGIQVVRLNAIKGTKKTINL